MSTIIIAKVWPLQMPPSPKAVLVSLADNANDHGECWPSIPLICQRTCLGRSTVIEAIKWLEEAGMVEVDRSRRHNRYTLKIPGPDLFAAPVKVAAPVRQADQYGSRTSPAGERQWSGCRTSPVREPDPNRQEPSRTAKSVRQRAETGTSTTRGTRLPDDWTPGPEVQAWTKERMPGLDLDEAADEFRDYWRAVPGAKGRKLDWDATFRNRLREVAGRRQQPVAGRWHRESLVDRAMRKAREAQTASPDALMVAQ